MENLLEKLSSYNLLNNMLPGSIFCYLLEKNFAFNLLSENVIGNLFMYYFAGMVISRIGSIIVEPFCKWTKFVEFAHYTDFIEASKIDEKIDILSETNNTYRTFLALFTSIAGIKLYHYLSNKYIWLIEIAPTLCVLLLIVLFAYSYKKQTQYVKKRVNNIIHKSNDN